MKEQFTFDEFEALVVEALEALPPFFQDKLQNISVVVANRPTPSEKAAVGLKPGHLLFGLYQGIPLTRRTTHYSLVLPDKITIFRVPIQSVCHTREQVITQVQRTVKHEIAHHFGISDDRLRELGAY